MIAEFQAWVVFFNHSKGVTAKLPSEGGVYSDLYRSLLRRAEESSRVFENWLEKEKRVAHGEGGPKL